jgi:hypothetical protein
VARLQRSIVVIPWMGGTVPATKGEATELGRARLPLSTRLAWPERVSGTEHPELVPLDAVPATRILPWTVIRSYDGLFSKLQKAFANVNRGRHAARTRSESQRKGADFSVRLPAIDHRGGCETAVPDGRQVALEAESRQVVVVAHSMGGLVARHWVGPVGGTPCCQALITVGSMSGTLCALHG